MTGLASDLRAIVERSAGVPDHSRTGVPVGLLRACLIHVERFDGGPLVDRGREARLRAEDERAQQEREVA